MPNSVSNDGVGLAVIFPGQGSQSLGMMSELRQDDRYRKQIEQTFEQASDALSLDMWQLVNDERLNDTKFTQPAILTASIAIWRVISDKLPTPSYLAGHSLGEYSALVASGVIDFDDAVKLVHMRGKLMTTAVQDIDTKMSAILGLEDEQVIALCEHASGIGTVNPANFNSKGQIVIAGQTQAVDWVMNECQNLGAKSIVLKVSVPSHCKLMTKASDVLADLLQDVRFFEPKIAVIQNVNAKVAKNANDIKQALINQLSNPVQWTATMQSLADKKIQLLVECGYGNVLSNLAKRQQTPIATFATDRPDKIDKLLERLNES